MLYCTHETQRGTRPPGHTRRRMSRNYFIIAAAAASLFLQSCCLQCLTQEGSARKQREEHEAQYAPYRQQNTAEAYREFIKKYPKNMFAGAARDLGDSLEFAPYEKADTLEGYMEFIIICPDNLNVSRALARIEQLEFKRYETLDTIEGYKEFLAKYPKNAYSILAKDRLQDLEVRAFDEETRKKYGFDLLLYRLQAKKIQERSEPDGEVPAGNFSIFASLDTAEGKKYFHTHVIYPDDLSGLDAASPRVREKFFSRVIVKLIAYLEKKFACKNAIDGFSFDISSSPARFYGDKEVLLEYYFSGQDARLFAGSGLDGAQLLARAAIVIPEKKKPAPAPAPRLDGNEIMTRVCARDAGRDSIITRSWKLTFKSGRADAMNTIEKWKSFAGADGVRDKSLIRYMSAGYGGSFEKKQAAAILTVSYTQKAKEFWYVMYRGDAGRTSLLNTYRSRAESDFPLADYVEIKSSEEKHALLRDEAYENAPCVVVESVPVQAQSCYGKRVSWIDTKNWIPLKIDYFDKKGALWKTLHITWQSRFGLWFWEQAVVDNALTGDRTTIITKDVRVNVGLPDLDFSRYALEQLSER